MEISSGKSFVLKIALFLSLFLHIERRRVGHQAGLPNQGRNAEIKYDVNIVSTILLHYFGDAGVVTLKYKFCVHNCLFVVWYFIWKNWLTPQLQALIHHSNHLITTRWCSSAERIVVPCTVRITLGSFLQVVAFHLG